VIIKQLSYKFDTQDTDYFFDHLYAEFVPHALNIIMGDNGVGKSTFFSILCDNISAHAQLTATLEVGGTGYEAVNNHMPNAFVQHVHMVQQQYDAMLADQFSFKQNLQFACLPCYPGLHALPQAQLFDIINDMNIDIDKPAYLLSGGQRQLLAILMALQKSTKLLLLDEPTATLDKKNAVLIMEALAKLAQKLHVTMLIISHDHGLINNYAARSFVLEKDEQGKRAITLVR